MKSFAQGKKNLKAIILAAGYATRLYPLTRQLPKPLLKVTKDKTIIDLMVDELVKSLLFDEIFVVTNQKFYPDFCRWAKKHKTRVPLVVLNDGTHSNSDRLGAIGDLSLVVSKGKINSDVVVVGGDNLFDRGLGHFLTFALRHRDSASMALYDLKCKKEASRFGIVLLDRKKKIMHFDEKPARPKSTLAATCLYYFPKRALLELRCYMKDRRTPKDAPGNFIHWLITRESVYGYVLKEGHWYDIGQIESYKEVLRQMNRWST